MLKNVFVKASFMFFFQGRGKRENGETGSNENCELRIVNIVSWKSYSPTAVAICWTFSPARAACLLRFVQRQLGVVRDMFYSSPTYFSLPFSHVKFAVICLQNLHVKTLKREASMIFLAQLKRRLFLESQVFLLDRVWGSDSELWLLTREH